jgi:hypothetical protein
MAASVSSPIRATIGGQQYTSTSNLSLSLATTGAGGLDTGSVAIGTYYLYLVVSGGALALVASLSTAPSGFSVHKQIERVRVGINESSAIAILDIKTEAEYLTELAEVKNNYIINGAFDFWQRNVTFSTPSNGAANADRFKHFYDGAGSAFTISRQSYALGIGETLDGNPKFYHRLQVTTAGSGSTVRYSKTAIEGVHNLAGKVVTLSFYASADSNRTIRVQIAQIFGTGGSPSPTVSTNISNINITNVFTKYNVTFRVPSISGKTLGTNKDDYIEIQIHFPLNTAMTIDLGQMMLNDGAFPAPFALAGGDIAGELAKCQRYYFKTYPMDVFAGATNTWAGVALGHVMWVGGNDMDAHLRYPTRLRIAPNEGGLYSPVNGAFNTIGRGNGVNFSVTNVTYSETGMYATWNNNSGVDDMIEGFHVAIGAEL